MRRRLLLGLVPAVPAAVLLGLFGACSTRPVNLGLALTFPEGLLDEATSVQLSVFDASLGKCDAATGTVTTVPPSALSFPLANTSCPAGETWCATITLDRDGSTKVFSVVASRAGATIASGCTTAVIDQDPLVVDIQALRYLPPPCCNDGIIQPGEQCDNATPGACMAGGPVAACSDIVEDAVCNCDCTSREIPLSHDDSGPPGLKELPVGSKTDLALSFGPGSAVNPEMLRAVYESSDATTTTGYDLHASFLGADLYPITDPEPLSLQLQFPVLCSNVEQSAGQALDQRYPRIATASEDTVVVVYQSNQNNIGPLWDVFLTPQLPEGCTDDDEPCTADTDCQTSCSAGGTCATSVQLDTLGPGATDPHVTGGPDGLVLVTWTRTTGIYGRIWRTNGALIPPTGEFQVAPQGSAARVAGWMNGFTVVYQGTGPGDSAGVFMRQIDTTGYVSADVGVNTVPTGVQDQPDIAMLADGTTLVVWHSGSDIYFQRYDSKGTAAPDDQNTPLNTVGAHDDTNQQHPVAAGANGFFVVAWETPGKTAGTTDIAARFLGAAGGFGYNSVDGQNDQFTATDGTVMGDRHNPAVAMSAYTAIGWEDHATASAGVWVRRFPAPTM